MFDEPLLSADGQSDRLAELPESLEFSPQLLRGGRDVTRGQ